MKPIVLYLQILVVVCVKSDIKLCSNIVKSDIINLKNKEYVKCSNNREYKENNKNNKYSCVKYSGRRKGKRKRKKTKIIDKK